MKLRSSEKIAAKNFMMQAWLNMVEMKMHHLVKAAFRFWHSFFNFFIQFGDVSNPQTHVHRLYEVCFFLGGKVPIQVNLRNMFLLVT